MTFAQLREGNKLEKYSTSLMKCHMLGMFMSLFGQQERKRKKTRKFKSQQVPFYCHNLLFIHY